MNLHRLFIKTCDYIGKLPVVLERRRYYREDNAIFKIEKERIEKIQWTDEQQAEFDRFWKENYGRPIPSECTRLWESICSEKQAKDM